MTTEAMWFMARGKLNTMRASGLDLKSGVFILIYNRLSSYRSGYRTKIPGRPSSIYLQRNKELQSPNLSSLDALRLPLPSHMILSKAGIKVCANQKLNTSFGPVINNFGVRPLKKLVMPSFLIILPTIRNPLSGFSKLRF